MIAELNNHDWCCQFSTENYPQKYFPVCEMYYLVFVLFVIVEYAFTNEFVFQM